MTSRFRNIDALRGIASLAVVLFHLIGGFSPFASSPSILYVIPAYGFTGVYLFFVISGFCIHLRWTKQVVAGVEKPDLNFKAFWKRRWIRLYPAYIATLALFIGWNYYQGKINFDQFFFYDLFSHLLMLHNFDARTVYSFNSVLWTLAIEEQLYLLYFLMLWLRKRIGWTKTLLIAFSLRLLWFLVSFLIQPYFNLPFNEGSFANWWIWILGAVSVEAYFGVIKLPKWNYSITLSLICFFVAGFLKLGQTLNLKGITQIDLLLEPCVWGLGFYFLINRLMLIEDKSKNFITLILASLGLISYSLYLTHEFVIDFLIGWNSTLILVATILFAYFYFLLFEKRFIKK